MNIITTIGEGIIEFPNSDDSWDNDTGSDDTMVMSWDVNGNWYFASFIGAGEQVIGLDIESTQQGSFYVTGSFNGEASFVGSDIVLNTEGDAIDGYVVKYDLQGDAIWAKQFGFSFAEGFKVTSDAHENVYVLGSFSEKIIFAMDTDEPVILNTNSENDLFIAMYDSAGTFKWVKQLAGTGSEGVDRIARKEVPFRTTPLDIFYADEDGGMLYLFGDYNGTLDLAPFTLTSPENSQAGFIAKLSVKDLNTSIENGKTLQNPNSITLNQNFPNPFNPSTTIGFTLSQAEFVSLDIFNMLGQKVKAVTHSNLGTGYHEFQIQADDLSSGTYFYTLKTGNAVQTKSMVLIK
ncbi:T9SS type A sorting domain-containing protein [bacterium]|nr:MAG: T9SS type A sorting domain-containing protein [bacterium]